MPLLVWKMHHANASVVSSMFDFAQPHIDLALFLRGEEICHRPTQLHGRSRDKTCWPHLSSHSTEGLHPPSNVFAEPGGKPYFFGRSKSLGLAKAYRAECMQSLTA